MAQPVMQIPAEPPPPPEPAEAPLLEPAPPPPPAPQPLRKIRLTPAGTFQLYGPDPDCVFTPSS